MGVRQDNVQINVEIGGKAAGQTLGELQKQGQQLNRELKQMAIGSEAFAKKAAELKTVNKSLEEVKQSVKGVEENLGAAREEMVKMTPFGGLINNLKGGFDNLKGGISTAAKGFTTLKGAIASTGIGLLLVAFASLVSYFKLTDEGSEKLERGLAMIKAIVDTLLGRVVEFGKNIVSAFENPVESVKKLGDLIVTNLINRVKAFAVIWQGIKTGNFQQVTDGVIQLGTGITDATAKLKQIGQGFKNLAGEAWDAANAAAEFTRRTQELEDAERDLSVMNERRKGQIEQLIDASKNVGLSEQARLESLKQAGIIEEQMTKDAIKNAQERLDIIKGENARAEKLNLLNDDAKDKQAQAEIALIQIQNNSAQIRQNIANREAKFIKELNEQRIKALRDYEKAQQDYNKRLLESEAYLEDLRVANMEEGLQKKLATMQASYNEEQASIKQNIEETLKLENISNTQRARLLKNYHEQAILLEGAFNKSVGNVRLEYQAKIDKKYQEGKNKSDLAEADLAIWRARENSQKLLEAKLDKLDLEKEIELQNKELTEEEKHAIDLRYIQAAEELYAEHAEKKKEMDRQVAEAGKNLLQGGLQAIIDFGAIKTDIEIAQAERSKNERISKLDQELKTKKITQDAFDSQKALAEQNFAKKQRKLKQDQAKKEKAIAITMATIDTIQGTIKAFMNAGNPILGAIMAAITAAAGAFQIAKIASTPIPEFSQGGVILGSSHDEGGIRMTDNKTGAQVGEMEGDELIMTRGVYRNPALRAAASRINVLGGGRAFESGGVVNPLSNLAVSPEGKIVENSPGSASVSSTDIKVLIEEVRATRRAYEASNKLMKAYVVYSEIEEAKNTMDAVRSDAALK